MFWNSSDDKHNTAESRAMTRNRFGKIMQYLHSQDNNKFVQTDKLAKVTLLLTLLNENFLNHFLDQAMLLIDKSMIQYFGCDGMKQFIRGKPLRFEYKVWSLNTPQGYCILFELYQGSGKKKCWL